MPEDQAQQGFVLRHLRTGPVLQRVHALLREPQPRQVVVSMVQVQVPVGAADEPRGVTSFKRETVQHRHWVVVAL